MKQLGQFLHIIDEQQLGHCRDNGCRLFEEQAAEFLARAGLFSHTVYYVRTISIQPKQTPMKLLISLTLSLILGSVICAQESSNPPSQSVVVHSYESEVRKLEDAYRKELKRLDAFFVKNLKEKRDAAVKTLEELQKKVATDDLDKAVKIRDKVRELEAMPLNPPQFSTPDGMRTVPDKMIKDLERDSSQTRAQLELYKLFHPLIVVEQTVFTKSKRITKIFLSPGGKILLTDPGVTGTWALKGRILTFTWRSQKGVVVDTNRLDESLTTFDGKGSGGLRLAGRVLLGSFKKE